MEELQKDHLSGMDLQIDQEVRQSLNDAGKWTKFISITIFTICGLMLVFSVLGSSAIMGMIDKLSAGSENILGKFSGPVLIAIITFVILIVGFIYYFLYNFSVKIKAALQNEDVGTFNNALKSLKIFFIITTVLSIITVLNSMYELFA